MEKSQRWLCAASLLHWLVWRAIKLASLGFQTLCLWEAPVLQMHLLSEHESLGQMTSEVERG